jgi:hypothetical protein
MHRIKSLFNTSYTRLPDNKDTKREGLPDSKSSGLPQVEEELLFAAIDPDDLDGAGDLLPNVEFVSHTADVERQVQHDLQGERIGGTAFNWAVVRVGLEQFASDGIATAFGQIAAIFLRSAATSMALALTGEEDPGNVAIGSLLISGTMLLATAPAVLRGAELLLAQAGLDKKYAKVVALLCYGTMCGSALISGGLSDSGLAGKGLALFSGSAGAAFARVCRDIKKQLIKDVGGTLVIADEEGTEIEGDDSLDKRTAKYKPSILELNTLIYGTGCMLHRIHASPALGSLAGPSDNYVDTLERNSGPALSAIILEAFDGLTGVINQAVVISAHLKPGEQLAYKPGGGVARFMENLRSFLGRNGEENCRKIRDLMKANGGMRVLTGVPMDIPIASLHHFEDDGDGRTAAMLFVAFLQTMTEFRGWLVARGLAAEAARIGGQLTQLQNVVGEQGPAGEPQRQPLPRLIDNKYERSSYGAFDNLERPTVHPSPENKGRALDEIPTEVDDDRDLSVSISLPLQDRLLPCQFGLLAQGTRIKVNGKAATIFDKPTGKAWRLVAYADRIGANELDALNADIEITLDLE